MSALPVIPSLSALRAFEATMRHMSLKGAAEELHVTPAAVSHQIQHLETTLGTTLFVRKHRAIEPTEAARRCLPKIQDGFDCLREALDRAVDCYPNVLTIGAPPSLSSRWLMPKLHRFATKFPDVILRVLVKTRLPLPLSRIRRAELENVLRWTEECDVLLVYGSGAYPGLKVESLFPTEIAPLCSPRLLSKNKRLSKPSDISHFELVHDDRGLLYEGKAFWDIWLARNRVRGIDTQTGLHFDHSAFAIQAAVEGCGVVATTPVLAESELISGALVMPFPQKIQLDSGYFIVTNESGPKRRIIEQFSEWAQTEIATSKILVGRAPGCH